MTTFLDGPAQGQKLSLKHAPQYLRVVCDAQGKWDALDLPQDVPKPGETLYAYQVHEYQGMIHIYARKGGGGFFPIASYKLMPVQPDQPTMRDTRLWYQFCHEEF